MSTHLVIDLACSIRGTRMISVFNQFNRGLSGTIFLAVAGRIIAGFGGAGMNEIVSVLINGMLILTSLVQLSE